ncbi:unnamed protein product [Miscanthus lutarioriparius]|uniref:Uncharacterized protein n=1 Tax=Miscanthus lutarioriparius TaxID=422564 RepID=A0A811R1S4_9POAL|nr:unnamed protein product [Miscanthus lutarioriparius]
MAFAVASKRAPLAVAGLLKKLLLAAPSASASGAAAGGLLAVLMRAGIGIQIGACGGERSAACLLVSELMDREIALPVFAAVAMRMHAMCLWNCCSLR